MSKHPTSILITGASSGIGAALALVYAGPNVDLFLSGRDQNRLIKIAQACREKGAKVFEQTISVTDQSAMATWILDADSQAPLDLVVANAGISGGSDSQNEELSRQIFATNVDGVLNTVLPIIPRMISRKRGQLALMSSLAGFRGLPSAPAYSASKAAVRSYGEALRGSLSNDGIKVSVICPGFVESRITEKNKFYMPLLMTAPKAANIIKMGLANNKPRIAFPFLMYAVVWLMSALPTMLMDPIVNRLPKKK
ncbi:MAG: SDR family NAD(P)-dependent oxidoreductase [Rhodospirillaceae bacterium]|jgi:short-subunit dehydrogenase|nr:SDR family NAD(P)-dependent oxidoreductase [Rhodospirillales bacterium]MBT3905181.1 SDR family NAD(P)-dependent oxidoreductase [Rhodospirillaceae bacterium]MBT4702226.1 SDR family NAD(P)-dependent oxidoreductase [Rhodospirillaceae bacterium]MBT5035793.1 SDR family NAD(P)-dependent oxidoreductase [Rhodospirillaceae bacterium]MBT6218796.1 SDR family NAD(P)-dependent oxidoreductase [Rhodospirillaceae bacterium]